jgi:hypothetical protein
LLVKSIVARWYSLSAFIAAQILIDCETLYHLVRHETPVHRTLHTFAGATLAGAVTAVGLLGLRWLAGRIKSRGSEARPASLPSVRSEMTTTGIWVGALAGGVSHPWLDGLMHRDMQPFAPWSSANPFLGIVSVEVLHLGCVAAGLLGVGLMVWQLYGDQRAA